MLVKIPESFNSSIEKIKFPTRHLDIYNFSVNKTDFSIGIFRNKKKKTSLFVLLLFAQRFVEEGSYKN